VNRSTSIKCFSSVDFSQSFNELWLNSLTLSYWLILKQYWFVIWISKWTTEFEFEFLFCVTGPVCIFFLIVFMCWTTQFDLWLITTTHFDIWEALSNSASNSTSRTKYTTTTTTTWRYSQLLDLTWKKCLFNTFKCKEKSINFLTKYCVEFELELKDFEFSESKRPVTLSKPNEICVFICVFLSQSIDYCVCVCVYCVDLGGGKFKRLFLSTYKRQQVVIMKLKLKKQQQQDENQIVSTFHKEVEFVRYSCSNLFFVLFCWRFALSSTYCVLLFAISRLKHPNIVECYHGYTQLPNLYIVIGTQFSLFAHKRKLSLLLFYRCIEFDWIGSLPKRTHIIITTILSYFECF
jgi:hypothetical protein